MISILTLSSAVTNSAASYLNIKSLLDLTCQTVADMIKGKTPEAIRKTFNIKNASLQRKKRKSAGRMLGPLSEGYVDIALGLLYNYVRCYELREVFTCALVASEFWGEAISCGLVADYWHHQEVFTCALVASEFWGEAISCGLVASEFLLWGILPTANA
ncbi:hypothetical protein RJ640_026501 [Escallonia rubra]|uniref:SKP1 component dimerisation domain-containing protein n=1 Tax=Escallonia rubra TaxID=112253 RepID=A0AA88QVE2_9ASTE|nr:hypothetical protein RJ640_026501 [Escallonia rubra]